MEKPVVYLYEYKDNEFVAVAAIDDYEEISWETRLYEAGAFTIQINYNIPNAALFKKGMFVRIGRDKYKFGEIGDVENSLDNSGKVSQRRIITGYDARYLFHKRIIKDLNTSEAWTASGSGERCMRLLIDSQCGAGTEAKRRLPISNIISDGGIGSNYEVSEAYSNLYDVLVTIATQTQIGWRISFAGTLSLEVFPGEDRSSYIRFDASMQTIDSGTFTDSNDEFTNAVYIGGKGNGSDRDIYEAEEEGASGLTRYESWIEKSEFTEEAEYRIEALNILRQYSQTISLIGKGLAKSPYVFGVNYSIGDTVQFSFSGIKARVPVLSVTEHYAKGEYDIDMEVGKPVSDLNRQLSLLLRKIQSASASVASKSTSSIMWYDIPVDKEMKASEVTYDVIGFYDNAGTGERFKLYFSQSGTGSKIYHVYLRQLAGSGKLTLTTGVAGAADLQLNTGTYVTIIYVDKDGNITTIA